MNPALANLAAVAVGGAAGACLRYFVTLLSEQLLGRAFPYGTLLVNVLGSLVAGYLLVWLADGGESARLWRLLLLTGLLGGFTTYSAFSVEMLVWVQDGHWGKAAMYAAATLFTCFAAVCAGFILARGVQP